MPLGVKGQGKVVIKMDIDLSTKEEIEFRFNQFVRVLPYWFEIKQNRKAYTQNYSALQMR